MIESPRLYRCACVGAGVFTVYGLRQCCRCGRAVWTDQERDTILQRVKQR